MNESSIMKFKVQKGLRQGDLLISFFFNIVVEGLCDIMRQTIKNKLALTIWWVSQRWK